MKRRGAAVAVLATGFAAAAVIAPQATAAGCGTTLNVTTASALSDAAGNPCVKNIVVKGSIVDASTIELGPGQTLSGSTASSSVAFLPGVDGVEISRDNSIRNLRLTADKTQRAVFNDTQLTTMGAVGIAAVHTIGQVQLLAKDNLKAGNVTVNGLDVEAADTSPRYGLVGVFFGSPLEAMQGAFTLWNSQSDPSAVLTADLHGISVGRPGAPVTGSGVFLAGGFPLQVDSSNVASFGDILHQQSINPTHGSVKVNSLTTGSVYTQGSSVFVRNGAVAGSIAVFDGPSAPIATSLDVQGSVSTAGLTNGAINVYSDLKALNVSGDITSTGPNGFGVVTWPHIGSINVAGKLETFGLGARGFNAYAGQVNSASFGQIVTHGDGAVAVDVFRPLGKLVVKNGIQTTGGSGLSLVLGQLKQLQASAIGAAELVGSIGQIVSGGPISTAHDGITTVHVGAANSIGSLCARQGVESAAAGTPFDVLGQLTLTCDAALSTPFSGFSASNCVSTSTFTYNLAGLTSSQILFAKFYVNGKAVQVATALTANNVVLKGLPAGAFTLKIVATTTSGQSVVSERSYYGCSA
ncbi:MAG: hypothetical protein ACJ72L_14055 [Marmoricola sp.]